MEFKKIVERAIEIRKKFEVYEVKNVGKTWDREQIMQGLMVDIGDLAKLVMAKEGYRKVENVDMRLRHELSDCLWALIILSAKYGIDLEKAFVDTMNELDNAIEENQKM